jgi:hypothetical protein
MPTSALLHCADSELGFQKGFPTFHKACCFRIMENVQDQWIHQL